MLEKKITFESILLSTLMVLVILLTIVPIDFVNAYSTKPIYWFEEGIDDPLDPPRYGGECVFASDYDHGSWNGIIDYWSGRGERDQVLERLVLALPGDRYIGQLAERWENSPDGKVWTFYLRKGVLWSDGVPFTADDVINHWQLIGSSQTPGGVNFASYDLKSVEKLDSYTVRFTFGAVVNSPRLWSGWGTTLILPAHLYKAPMTAEELRNHPNNLKPVGTGPYLLVDYVPGQYIIFERNPLYWGMKPYLDRIIYKLIYTPEGRIAALQAGEVDISIASVPVSVMLDLVKSGEFASRKGVATGGRMVGFNFKKESVEANPWVVDKNVRLAMSMAINRDEIIQERFYGYSERIDGPIVNSSKWFDPAIKPRPYDPKKAEELLDAAGYPRGANGIRFSFEMPMYDTVADIGEIIKQMWREVGIECNLKSVQEGAFYSLYETSENGLGAYPCGLYNMGQNNVESVISICHGNRTIGVENLTFYNNTKATAAMEIYVNTAVEAEQLKEAYVIQEEIYNDVAFINLFSGSILSIWKANYRNVALNTLGGSGITQRRLIWDSSLPSSTPTPTPTPYAVNVTLPIPDWFKEAPSWYEMKPSWVPEAESNTIIYALLVLIIALQTYLTYTVSKARGH